MPRNARDVIQRQDRERFARALANFGFPHPDAVPWLVSIIVFVIIGLFSVVDWANLPQLQALWKRNLLLSILVGALTWTITWWLNKLIISYANIPEILYDVTHLAPSKWVGGDRDDSLEAIYKELVELRQDKRGVAFNFAIESLRQIIERGFIIFEANVDRYVEYLHYGIIGAQDVIFAACLVRPFWFLTNPQERTILGVPRPVGGYLARARHLLPYRDIGSSKKYRLVLLTKKDIILLIQDTLINSDFVSTTSPTKEYWELPEVQWFIEDVNRPPKKVCLYWSVQSPDWFEDAEDMMLFDGQISIQFEFVDEFAPMPKGHLFLRWGRNLYGSENSHLKDHIRLCLQEIDKDSHRQRSPKEWALFNPSTPRTFPVFRSIREYIRHSGIETTDLVLEDQKTGRSDAELDVINKFVKSAASVADLYDKILEGLNTGSLVFRSSVTMRSYDRKGEIRYDKDIPWQHNWKMVCGNG